MNYVTNMDQVREATTLNTSLRIEALLPYLEDAYNVFIVPLFPPNLLYKSFVIAQNEADPTLNTPDYQEEQPCIEVEKSKILHYFMLIHLLRKAETLYALWLSTDELAVYVSGAGIQVVQSDTNKPAPQYQIMNMKETLLTRAHQNIDLALKLIEDFAGEFDDKFGDFYDSSALIRSAAKFQIYTDIHSSRRVFLSLLPVMKSVTERYIIPTMTRELYDLLYFNNKPDQTLTPDDQALLDMILPALVHLTMARALEEINIDMLDWGIFNNSSNTFNNVQNKNLANESRIDAMQQAHRRDGDAGLKALQEFLDTTATADLYAAYFRSAKYGGPVAASTRGEFVNSATNAIFVV